MNTLKRILRLFLVGFFLLETASIAQQMGGPAPAGSLVRIYPQILFGDAAPGCTWNTTVIIRNTVNFTVDGFGQGSVGDPCHAEIEVLADGVEVLIDGVLRRSAEVALSPGASDRVVIEADRPLDDGALRISSSDDDPACTTGLSVDVSYQKIQDGKVVEAISLNEPTLATGKEDVFSFGIDLENSYGLAVFGENASGNITVEVLDESGQVFDTGMLTVNQGKHEAKLISEIVGRSDSGSGPGRIRLRTDDFNPAGESGSAGLAMTALCYTPRAPVQFGSVPVVRELSCGETGTKKCLDLRGIGGVSVEVLRDGEPKKIRKQGNRIIVEDNLVDFALTSGGTLSTEVLLAVVARNSSGLDLRITKDNGQQAVIRASDFLKDPRPGTITGAAIATFN